MKVTIERLIFLALAAGTLAFALLTILFLRDGFDSKGQLNSALFSTFVDGFKAIALGFIAGVLAATIPHLLPEKKFRFENLKDSRKAYSEAQTGVSYLPDRLASLKYPEAVAYLQSVHEALHVAQTYKDELPQHVHEGKALEWGGRNYEILKAIKHKLRKLVDVWDELSSEARLRHAIAAVMEGEAMCKTTKLSEEGLDNGTSDASTI